jgi:hypothetical protein
MIDALVQKIQLDEHDKFRCYVMFATMDMPIYRMRLGENYFQNLGFFFLNPAFWVRSSMFEQKPCNLILFL